MSNRQPKAQKQNRKLFLYFSVSFNISFRWGGSRDSGLGMSPIVQSNGIQILPSPFTALPLRIIPVPLPPNTSSAPPFSDCCVSHQATTILPTQFSVVVATVFRFFIFGFFFSIYFPLKKNGKVDAEKHRRTTLRSFFCVVNDWFANAIFFFKT